MNLSLFKTTTINYNRLAKMTMRNVYWNYKTKKLKIKKMSRNY